MESKEIDRQLILDYLQGHYTADQLSRIKEYLSNEVYRESLDKFLLEEWEAISRSPQPILPGLELKYRQFQSYLQQDGKIPATTIRPASVHRLPLSRLSRLAGVAAALAILVVAVWLLQPGRSGRENRSVAAQWIVFHNEPGKRNKIVLPDSSLVYLGTASTLKYNADYNRTGRKIFLEGEAYFVVRHDGHQPFTVATGDIATEDIGTEFNVRYYPGKPLIEVEVAKGKVEVRSTKRGADTPIAAIRQGQGLQYDTLTAQSTISAITDTGLVGSWRRGLLSFRKRPMKEVTDELERYYGVNIRYADPALENILLTTLLDNKNLEDALEIVTVTAGVRYNREGNIIFLNDASGHGPARKQ